MIAVLPIALLGGSIGSGETLLILLVAFVLFGPARLPVIARNVGRFLESLRKSARDFADELARASLETSGNRTSSEEQKKALQSSERPDAP